jgi:hypothetical protein
VLHVDVNPAGRALLAAQKGLALRAGGHIEASSPDDRHAFAAELRAALKPTALTVSAAFRPRVLPVHGACGRLHLSLNSLPLHSDRTPVSAAAAIFVADPDARPRDLKDTLRALWGLTPAEAALTNAMVQGQTLQQ